MAYRAALLGCGKIGSEFSEDPKVRGIHSHAAAYTHCPATELIAVCDTNPEKVKRCGKRWGVAAQYTDPRTMLEIEQPEIVSVCTPDATHVELIRCAVETPGVLAVLAEKPLALQVGDAAEVVRLAADRGVLLAVNYTRRYCERHARLRDWVRSGGLGEIQSVAGYYTKGLLHNGTHWIDLARFFLGEVTWAWGADVRGDPGEDPTLDAFFRFESGATGSLVGADAHAYNLFEFDLVGTRGRLRITDLGEVFEIFEVVDSPRFSAYKELATRACHRDGLRDVLKYAVDDLVSCIDQKQIPRCSGADGLAALQVAAAIRASSLTGFMVPLDAPRE
jgi:predicted dehydrogenase